MADLSKELNKELNKDFAYCEDALGRAENAIGNLPSAQPEWHESPKNALYIRKADAIEICMEQIESPINTYFEKGTAEIIKEKITELPSAQPEKRTEKRTETHSCDLIDRQAALDALWKALYEYEDKTGKQFQESEDLDVEDWIQHRIFVQNMSDIDRQTIMDLPSAQPEIIRCKDCKHFHYDMPYVIQGIPVLGHEVCDFWGDGCKTSENGFCSFAEE